jgi:hypothetical protein
MFNAFRYLAVILVFICVSLSAATVTISNNYYTDNNDVKDEVYLDNIGYDNSVDIYPDSITGMGSAVSSDNKIGEFDAKLNYPDANMGAYLHAKGSAVRGTKSFDLRPNYASMDLSYGIKNGESDSAVYNSYTTARHSLKMNGCEYFGSISMRPSSILLSGNGHRSLNDLSIGEISQDLYLQHKGRSADIDLTVSEITDFGDPLMFEWQNYVSSFYDHQAASSVDFFVHHGEREARFEMIGTSTKSEIIDGLIESGVEGITADEHWWMRYTLS